MGQVSSPEQIYLGDIPEINFYEANFIKVEICSMGRFVWTVLVFMNYEIFFVIFDL